MEHRNVLDPTASPGRTGAASPNAGATTFSGAHPAALKRKLTLLQLIDELSALKEDDHNLHGSFYHEEKKDKDHFIPEDVYEDPSLSEGVAAFKRFDQHVNALIQRLLSFQSAARQLGSSVGLLASASELCSRLHVIELIFHENASDLYPNAIKSKVMDIEPPKTKRTRPQRGRSYSRAMFVRPAAVTNAPEPETLPAELLGLAKGIKAFLFHLEEFPEFVDAALNVSITSFERDLIYRADSLTEYEGQFRWPAVQRYVASVGSEMTEHLHMINLALKDFIENGVPAIRFAQQSNGENLLFLSTIATFFSGVTATTAQYSYATTETPLQSIVNLFFFGSLILSISAAINSLLGLTWKRAMYRSPRHRVPWWVLIWIKRSPLVFMVVAVGMFSTGLVCFCYSTQTAWVAGTVLVLTCLCTMGLIAVSAWFIAERWIASKHNGLRWLSDVYHDHWIKFVKYPPIRAIRHAPKRAKDHLKRHFKRFHHSLSSRGSSIPDDALPFSNGIDDREKATPSPISYRHPPVSGSVLAISESPVATTHPNPPVEVASPAPDTPPPPRKIPTRLFSLASASLAASESAHTIASQVAAGTGDKTPTIGPPPRPTGANLFRQLAWKVASEQQASMPMSPHRGMSHTRSATTSSDPGKRRENPDDMAQQKKAKQLTALRASLKKLQVTDYIPDHTALVRHLQFSPNGKILCTVGWDGTVRLFDIPATQGEEIGRKNVMIVTGRSFGTVHMWQQAAWSPDGQHLLTRWMTGIQVWTEAGQRKQTIARGKTVRSIAWMPSSQSFLSVEGDGVVEISVDGVVLHTHQLPRLELQDVAVTPDEERMLGVASLLSTRQGFNPSLSRPEKRVVVYNLKDKEIENLVPVLDDVKDVTISRDGMQALVSFENKGPPQLYRLDLVKDKANDDDETMRLQPHRTYIPKTPVDFAGPSYFAGPNDEFILVPTKTGEVLFWDAESGRHLHALRNKDVGDGDLTSVAWNYAAKRHMLASSCHDGSVRIWTSTVEASRGKEREHPHPHPQGRVFPASAAAAATAPAPYGEDHDRVASPSPMPSSRRPTVTDPHPHAPARSSMDGSAEGAGPLFMDGDGGMRRRVDSPVPSTEHHEDR